MEARDSWHYRSVGAYLASDACQLAHQLTCIREWQSFVIAVGGMFNALAGLLHAGYATYWISTHRAE